MILPEETPITHIPVTKKISKLRGLRKELLREGIADDVTRAGRLANGVITTLLKDNNLKSVAEFFSSGANLKLVTKSSSAAAASGAASITLDRIPMSYIEVLAFPVEFPNLTETETSRTIATLQKFFRLRLGAEVEGGARGGAEGGADGETGGGVGGGAAARVEDTPGSGLERGGAARAFGYHDDKGRT